MLDSCVVRSYLFLGGILSSAISAMMLLRLGSWMFGGRGGFAHTAELYGGLAVFIGYVLFDTQVRIVRLQPPAGTHYHVVMRMNECQRRGWA